ncbi:MAG: hypothetical protein LUQ11_10390 [Methylococcaceae bacterium]|nr:hypothetical protein [Methylococcaceae bacterium]
MRPISELYQLMDARALHTVQTAESDATLLRTVFVAFGVALVFMLWRSYQALRATLGCSVDELHANITRLGSGDFSSAIPIDKAKEHRVVA